MAYYENIESFYETHKDSLINGDLRPVVSYNKDAEEYINKLVKIYESNGCPNEITLKQLEKGLEVSVGSNVASTESPLTWSSLGLIVESGDIVTKKSANYKYKFTDEFIDLAQHKMTPGVHILNKLFAIDSLPKITKFINLLICTLREGYLEDYIIDFPRDNSLYLNTVKDEAKREEYSLRINKIYGYGIDTSKSPHASMRAINNLVKLELISQNGNNEDGFPQYIITQYGHRLLDTIDKNLCEKPIHKTHTLSNEPINSPLQQIFYGAPGTGKSHEINRLTEGEKIIRTTFHPDSDYSTFVGAYKPIMKEVDVHVVPVVVDNGISLKPNGTYQEKRITYQFVKQSFLKAYLGAWKKYADSCFICCTPAVHEFDTGNGRYVITSVGDYGLTLSREFKFPKNLVQKEWTNLWNNAKFNVPRGQQTGKSVQHAIANWIFEKIDACTVDKFEEGWKKLVDTVKNGPVAVQKTQTYIIIAVDDDNETLTINVEARGKKRPTLRRKFYESDETKPSKLEKTLVGILEGYSKNDFDEAWDKLKKKVEEGKSPNFQDDSDGQIVPQFLVIEEINRGNCAQIFGDIFQLLDRGDNGFSVYPIEADSDLRDAIKEAFTKEEEYKLSNGIDIDDEVIDYTSNYEARLSEDVQEGRVLLLPPNLYIWATMNTSDQSLFPIDSAFKRRWDWVYTPIAQGKDENGNLMKWEIEGQGENSWWTFIQGINEVIDVTTHSEDKKLGFFFCKAQNDVVKKETFVNKVVFYLWNDVFKVYGFKSDIFNKKDKDDNTEKITFKSFYNEDGSVNEDTISVFVKNVMAKAPKGKANGEAPVATEEQNEEGETQA